MNNLYLNFCPLCGYSGKSHESSYADSFCFGCQSEKHLNIKYTYYVNNYNEYIHILDSISKSYIKYFFPFKGIKPKLDVSYNDLPIDFDFLNHKHPLMELFAKALSKIEETKIFK